jgi:transposase
MTSLEQRQKIKQMVEEGYRSPEIAKVVKTSVHTIRKWRRRIKKGVHYTPRWGVPTMER